MSPRAGGGGGGLTKKIEYCGKALVGRRLGLRDRRLTGEPRPGGPLRRLPFRRERKRKG